MSKRIAIIGAGSWGSALAIVASTTGHQVQIWSRNAAVIDAINIDRANPTYLGGVRFADSVRATGDILEVIKGAELLILAAPSHATRGLLRNMAPSLQSETILVSATKGIEIETGQRISQIVAEVIPIKT